MSIHIASKADEWRVSAQCLGTDPSLFYPVEADPLSEQAKAAKAICAVCPVQEPCLEWAIAANERDGIWGGMTEDERRGHRRRLLRQRFHARQREEQGQTVLF